MDHLHLNSVDGVEITTLQDNSIDVTVMDNGPVVTRAAAVEGGQFRKSVLSEHGFSALVKTTRKDDSRTMLFDFGFSEIGAAYNARVLDIPMETVEAMALSHGHIDHAGGLKNLLALTGKSGVELVVHPDVFKSPRYLKLGEELKIHFPKLDKAIIESWGAKVTETKAPYPMLAGDALFLGEIERTTEFEKGFPVAHYSENGEERWDPINDDTSVVFNLKDKGLVIVSGCAHAGIVNTIRYARKVTGVDKIHAVIGGFHLSGFFFEPIIPTTIDALKEFAPRYIVPTHCTGRKAIAEIEKAMPESFILNMSGTKLTFRAEE
ncbi:MAG: MBL fold metallo-hydrolase [Smithellaceae bacterium]|nr:MBL fold metallo-hydrolase [Smithellaceae bacterium]